MKIILVGFMCSGKSTVGRALAPLLGLHFIDLDREIEKRVGPLLPYVQREGEEAFRIVESEVLSEVLDGGDAVIAAGGGTPTNAKNLSLMLRRGRVVWLDASLAALLPRIERAGGDRPLLFGLKGDALKARVESLLSERLPVYRQAHIRIAADVAPSSVAARVADAVTGQLR